MKQKFFVVLLSWFLVFGLVWCGQVDETIDDQKPIDNQNSEINKIDNSVLNDVIDSVDKKILEL